MGSVALQFIGGLLIFLFGMNLVRSRLEKASGDKLRSAVNRLIKDRFRGFLIGIVSTFIMESSGAATVMYVGFASVGILDLAQAIALTAGATVGTTLFVMILAHFISYKLINFSFALVIIGFSVSLVKKRGVVKYLADAVIGFGILFLGIHFMIEGVSVLGGNEFFTRQIAAFANNPLLGILISAVFTAIVHSSAGTIAIALSLTTLKIIDLEAALPIVIGANIGTCFTAILASLSTTLEGKRVAWSHLIIKLVGSALLYPFLAYYAHFIQMISSNLNYQVALSHFFFNLFNALLVLAGLNLYEKSIMKLMPDQDDEEAMIRTKFLDTGALDTPQVAFGNVVRELLRMADICQEMFKISIVPFERNDKTVLQKIGEMDDHVDFLNEEIKFYLAKITQSELTDRQAATEMDLININNNFEIVGDIISKTIGELAQEKIRTGVEFSKEGWGDISKYHSTVLGNFHIAVSAFASNDLELARQVDYKKRVIGKMEDDLKEAHFMRLAQGMKESLVTSSIHLELLGHYRRINTYITKIVFPVIDRHKHSKKKK